MVDRLSLQFTGDFRRAGGADVPPLERADVFGVAAEHAGGLILFQNNGVILDEDLERIAVSAISRVRRSSIGKTMRPRPSILRTIPVDFMLFPPFNISQNRALVASAFV